MTFRLQNCIRAILIALMMLTALANQLKEVHFVFRAGVNDEAWD